MLFIGVRYVSGGDFLSGMRRMNIRVSDEIHEWFKVKSDKTGVSMSSLMFLALEAYVVNDKSMKVIESIPDLAKFLESRGV